MTIYFDSDIKCILYLKDEKTKEFNIKWSFLTNGFLSSIYNEFDSDWLYLDAFYESGNPCGRLTNSQAIEKLKDSELKKSDFESLVADNFLIDCEVYLKSEPENPRFFTITKEDLLNKFVTELYDLYGSDWKFFVTYFNDSQELAYGTIVNDSNRRRNQRLTYSGLKQRRFAINKEKWKGKSNLQNEIFYILTFKNKDFIKIGHTFRRFEYRLYNYLFPYSDKEISFYLDTSIDFENSFIVETNKKMIEIKTFKTTSLESEVIDKFSEYRHPDKSKFGNTKEILTNDCFANIKAFLNDLLLTNKNWNIKTLFEYTGFENSDQMKEYNLKLGVSEKTNKFYSKKQNPTIYLKSTTANKGCS